MYMYAYALKQLEVVSWFHTNETCLSEHMIHLHQTQGSLNHEMSMPYSIECMLS